MIGTPNVQCFAKASPALEGGQEGGAVPVQHTFFAVTIYRSDTDFMHEIMLESDFLSLYKIFHYMNTVTKSEAIRKSIYCKQTYR